MAEDQQGPNKRVTSSPCSSPLLSPIFPSTATSLSPTTGDTQGLVAGSSKNQSGRLQLLLAKPVYTDGGKLHYFCEGRGGGGEGGGLAEFTEVVYKLGGRERSVRTLPVCYTSSGSPPTPPVNLSTPPLPHGFYVFINLKTSPEALYIHFGKQSLL